MPTLTPDEARERFGELINRPSRTYREFTDPDGHGIWRPVYVDGEITRYRVHQGSRSPTWPLNRLALG